ncbi:MAG: hypothetical protein P4L70_04280 [Parasulfuritortus sp.]|nr:hypothetical protein [Parasulfuritortus sp.]
MTHKTALTLLVGLLNTPLLAAAAGSGSHGSVDTVNVLADQDALPLSKDDLFGTSEQPVAPTTKSEPSLPASKDSLFDEGSVTPNAKVETSYPITGFAETALAYTYSDPEHWSDALGRLQLSTQGQFGQGVKWKVTGRAEYNAIYDLTNHYADSVAHNQRTKFQFEETYLDFATGSLDWRVGRQQIVWGEMVGLFFADVVSAKDMREFILPDFNILRIPQWAARAEYFKDDFHAEAIWIPFPSYDQIGTPFDHARSGAGSDFYPYPISPAGIPIVMGEEKPGTQLGHGNFGIRLNQLTNGWDYSGFFYSGMDSQPTFYRDSANEQIFYPRHDRIWQAGGTLAKDMGSFVLKAETVYTNGRQFNVTDFASSNGLVEQNTLDWVVGLDFNPTQDTRVNTQLFQRIFINHAQDTVYDKYENGMSLLVNHKFADHWEAETMLIHSLNRKDWILRPKVTWRFKPDWRLAAGVDVFHGPPTGLFGQYDSQDRVYTEVRYDF